MNIVLVRRTVTEEMQPKPHVTAHWHTYELTLGTDVQNVKFVERLESHPAIKDVMFDILRGKFTISLSLLELSPEYAKTGEGAVQFIRDMEAGKASYILPESPAQGHLECSECHDILWDGEHEVIGAAKRIYCPSCAKLVRDAAL